MALSKQYILSKVSDHDIFEKYFGSFKLKKLYRSPLREDRHPSFNIYRNPSGKLRFKDFGGEQGDCLEFVRKLHRIDFRSALGRIAQDFNITDEGDFNEYRQTRSVWDHVPYVEIVISRLHFDYEVKPFPEFGTPIDLWTEGGITREILEEYDVKNLEWYSYVNEHGRKITRRAKLFDPIYVYEYGDDIVRFYRPNTKVRAFKWRGNTKSFDLFGLKQIKEKVPLCGILSGQKDAMALFANIGIRSVWKASESTLFTEDDFKQVQERSDHQFVLFDNDPPSKQYPEGPGMHFAKRISERFGIPAIELKQITAKKDVFAYFQQVIRSGEKEQLSRLIYDNIS